jgi:nucleoside-diphosphate-sugar epimerase
VKPGATVLVTGTRGSVGRVVATRLLERGFVVRGLDRNDAPDFLKSRPGFSAFRADLADLDAVRPLLEGVSAVIHCAGLNPDRLHEGREAFYRSNVLAAENVLKAAHEATAERAVLLTTVGVLKRRYGSVTPDDAGPHPPVNHYHWSKVEAERRIFALGLPDSLTVTVLRPCSIYGEGMRYKWHEIISLVRGGRMFLIGQEDAAYPLIHVDDVARAVLLALDAPAATLHRQAITLTSAEPCSIAQIVNFIADYYRVPRPRRLPYPPVLLASMLLRLVPASLKPRHLREVRPHNIRDYRYSLIFDHTKAERLLGFRAEVPFADGMRRMLDSLGPGAPSPPSSR